MKVFYRLPARYECIYFKIQFSYSVKKVLYSLLLTTQCHYAFSKYAQPFYPYYSQSGQDKYLVEEIFKHKKNGVFFDIGAHDGISYSNTYFLEKELGWTGICVEPQDQNFLLLEKNRKCIKLHGCIFDVEGNLKFLKVHGPSEMLSGILSSYDKRHLERAKKEVALLGSKIEIIKIKTFLFNKVCKKYNIKHIDFLSIDTEGSEENIIKSIDFNAINIMVIAVENNYNKNNIQKYLESYGYVLHKTLVEDTIFIKR